jgi:hypothetical protein
MGRLRRRKIIPEDTHIRATLDDGKLVQGNFGRQVEGMVKVTKAVDDEGNDYKGTSFKVWFSFSKDDDGEEFISYGSPLYQLLLMVRPNLEKVLDDENLSNSEYEKFLKKAVRDVDDLDIVARVGVKTNKKDETKQSNVLQSGTFGAYRDLDEALDEDVKDLDMGQEEEPPEEAA